MSCPPFKIPLFKFTESNWFELLGVVTDKKTVAEEFEKSIEVEL